MVNSFKNKNILITAGPTYERIDPVRFIGNFSSGKMGYAIAKEFADLGAHVKLISGPSCLSINHSNIDLIKIESAQEMYEKCLENFEQSEIIIKSAAVADYRPETIQTQKIKKSEQDLVIKLIKNPDILFELGKLKKSNQILIGFALETENQETNAKIKLEKKNLDAIILNSPNSENTGFQHDTNKICIINKNLLKFDFELKTKSEIAKDIVQYIENHLL